MLLRFFLAGVVLSAGLYRLAYPKLARQERQYLQLSHPYYTYLVAAVEIVVGVMLLVVQNTSRLRVCYGVLLALMGVGLARIAYHHYSTLLQTLPDIFIIHPTFTDFFLHITYGAILVSLMW